MYEIDHLEKLAYAALDEPSVSAAPPMVPGRVLHADADIFSYKACDTEYSYAENVQKLKGLITAWRILAGAEFIVLHLTMGHKGGREEIATVQKYQANRTKPDQEKVDRVRELRLWMAEYSNNNVTAAPQYEQEADDSMCQAMYRSIENGNDDVLFSSDKDLWMVPGKHLNKDTLEIEEFPLGYGWTNFENDKHGKKVLRGKGTSWFWHQMLMGDQADNIPGLPYLSKELVLKYAPTKALVTVKQRINSGRTVTGKLLSALQKRRDSDKYQELVRETDCKLVGPVLAQKYLVDCMTDKSAYHMVLDAYKAWYGKTTPKYAYYSWDNFFLQKTPYEMMVEQGRLLWMRRTEGEHVEEWFKEVQSK